MTYTVSFLRRSAKELADLPSASYERVRDAIQALGETPRPPGCIKLTGRDGWRIRIGDFRVIYEIDDGQRAVIILHVGNRRDIYRA